MARGGRASEEAGETEFQPFVPAEMRLAEITVKGIILGVLLSVILASANVYLGLFAGMTVSASIPAAVISMGALRLFRNRNILENNIVQTATSAGESLAAGVIFTIPALVLLGTWDSFAAHAWETILIAAFAGVLGVVFTVPLRRAFIVEANLRFPEGIACAEVLEAGEEGSHGIKIIALAAGVAAATKLFSGGFRLWKETADFAGRAGDALYGIGSNLSAALVAVGYIVGTNISIVIFSGGVITWLVAMPIYTGIEGPGVCAAPDAPYQEALCIWSTQLRYMGVGAMAVGGLYALVRLVGPLARGIRGGIEAYRHMRRAGEDTRPRTERDLPVPVLAGLAALAIVALFFVYVFFSESVPRSIVLALVMLVFGFLFASVAGYMAGLVGSSNNPISGVTIAATLVAGSVLVLMGISNELGQIATIAAAATIASAGAIAGDNMQDLKTGYLLGATPRSQQIAQVVGVTAAALAIPFILEVMRRSYGFCLGLPTDSAQCLAAPQANLIGSVAGAFFGSPIPWGLAGVGALVAVAIILVDLALEARGASFRVPVLAAAIGIYLPIELTTAIMIGGLVHLAVRRFHARRERLFADRVTRRARGRRDGLLFASGLIAGEAIMGILIGVTLLPPVARSLAWRPYEQGDNPLMLFEGGPQAFPIAGILVLAFVLFLLYYIGTRPFRPIAADEGADA